jgi:predicted DNA-binding transcriptional regulator AlpA
MTNANKDRKRRVGLPPPDNERLTLSIPELAKCMGISRGLAYNLAKTNMLPVKVLRLGGKRIVVSKNSVEILLSGKKSEGGNGDGNDTR